MVTTNISQSNSMVNLIAPEIEHLADSMHSSLLPRDNNKTLEFES